MAKLLIQDGALRYRPGLGLALDDCPECCGDPPSECCASGAALTSDGFTPTGPNSLSVDVAVSVDDGDFSFSYAGTITATGTSCTNLSGTGPVNSEGFAASVIIGLSPSNNGCSPDIVPRTFVQVRVSGPGRVHLMQGNSGPSGSWWRVVRSGTGNFCTSTVQGASSYSSSGSGSGGAGWSSSGSVLNLGGWSTGVSGSHTVTRTSPPIEYSASWSASIVTPLSVCSGVLAVGDQNCATCNDNNTGGFAV